MIRNLFTLVFLLSLSISHAQSDEDFQEYGTKVFKDVIDTNALTGTAYIRIGEYHQLIDRQPINANQKSLMKNKINVNFPIVQQRFFESLQYLWDTYEQERKDGAEMTYLDTEWEQLEDSEDIFTVKVNFSYKSKKVNTGVSLIFDAAWIPEEKRFVYIDDIKEDF